MLLIQTAVLLSRRRMGTKIIADVVTVLDRNNIRPTSLNMSSPTLDDVFLHHTGRRIRPEELGRKTTEAFLM